MSTNRSDIMTALSFSVESDFEIGAIESLYEESLMESQEAKFALESYISKKNDIAGASLESMLSFLSDALESDCEKKCKKDCEKDEDDDEDDDDKDDSDYDEDEDNDDDEDEDAEESYLRTACEAAERNAVQKGIALVKTIIAKFKQFITIITTNVANMARKFNAALTARRVKGEVKITSSAAKVIDNMDNIKHWAANISKGIGGADAQVANSLVKEFNKLITDEKADMEAGVTKDPAAIKNAMKDMSDLIKICNNALKVAEANVAKASGKNDLFEFGATNMRDAMNGLTKMVRAAFRSIMSAVHAAIKEESENKKNNSAEKSTDK